MDARCQIISYQGEEEPGEADLQSLIKPEAWVGIPKVPCFLNPEAAAKLIAEAAAEEIGTYPNNFYLAIGFGENEEIDFYSVHTELAPETTIRCII